MSHSVADAAVSSSIHAKYLRVRRILMAFRSHSRGALARYAPKIEHARMLQNAVGERVLKTLLRTGVLHRNGKFYGVLTK